MASHYKWYPASEEVTVPWNARYTFPSQANKAIKVTPRIQPKGAQTYGPGDTARFDFPAQGYVNTSATTLVFDADLSGYGTIGTSSTRFQNNIQSCFSRVRLMYGSTPLEDIIEYNVIVRALTEWTTSTTSDLDQTSIAEGIAGVYKTQAGVPKNARAYVIQGVGAADYGGNVPNEHAAATPRRRYQVQLAVGLMQQGKLLPTKFMASQLQIEITFAQAVDCLFVIPGTGSGTLPTYSLTNMTLLPEILEFDASYDAMFLQGLQQGGVPIKFSSWHHFSNVVPASSSASFIIQERSRSLKAIFAVMRESPSSLAVDSGALWNSNAANTWMTQYQFRIGGRYFPASPVQVSNATAYSGGCESFVELQKALNNLGDYRLSTAVNTTAFLPPYTVRNTGAFDGDGQIASFNTNGTPVGAAAAAAGSVDMNTVFRFGIATCLETSSGVEISGLNAEEQSDISLMVTWSGAQSTGSVMDVFTFYDAMIILKENNVLELIQ